MHDKVLINCYFYSFYMSRDEYNKFYIKKVKRLNNYIYNPFVKKIKKSKSSNSNLDNLGNLDNLNIYDYHLHSENSILNNLYNTYLSFFE